MARATALSHVRMRKQDNIEALFITKYHHRLKAGDKGHPAQPRHPYHRQSSPLRTFLSIHILHIMSAHTWSLVRYRVYFTLLFGRSLVVVGTSLFERLALVFVRTSGDCWAAFFGALGLGFGFVTLQVFRLTFIWPLQCGHLRVK